MTETKRSTSVACEKTKQNEQRQSSPSFHRERGELLQKRSCAWSWTKLSESSTSSPSPRVGHSLTPYVSPADGSRNVIVFGGASHEEGYLDECWILNLENFRWCRPNIKSSSTSLPSARYEHSAVRLPSGNGLLIFGGSGDDGLLNDLWSLDFDTFSWVKHVSKNPSPAPRTAHFASCTNSRTRDADATDRSVASYLYLYGGGGVGNIPIADTSVWRLSLDSLDWEQLSESGSNGPGARLGQSVTYLHDTDRILLFGGMDESGQILDDTWIFDVETRRWEKVISEGTNKARPSARTGHAASAIEGGRVLLYGGMTRREDGVPDVAGDVWIFHPDDAHFDSDIPKTKVDPTRPRARLASGMCPVRLYLQDDTTKSAVPDPTSFDLETVSTPKPQQERSVTSSVPTAAQPPPNNGVLKELLIGGEEEDVEHIVRTLTLENAPSFATSARKIDEDAEVKEDDHAKKGLSSRETVPSARLRARTKDGTLLMGGMDTLGMFNDAWILWTD